MPKIRTLLGFAISLLFFFLAVRKVEWKTVLSSLREIDPGFLSLTIASLFGSFICRAILWKSLLANKKTVSLRLSFESIIIGYMGNNILPLRMGELMRAHAIGKKEGLSKSFALASIVLERLLDLLSLLVFFVALLISMPLANWLLVSGGLVFTFLALMMIVIYFIASDLERFSSIMRKLAQFFPASVSDKALGIARSFIEGLALIRSQAQVARAIFLSLLTWFLMILSFYFGLKAFSMPLPFTASLLLAVVLNIGVMIPSSPGFIGIFQYLCVVSLSFFAVPKESALAFSMVLHAVSYVPVTLLGWFYWAKMHISLDSLQAAQKEEDLKSTFLK